MNIFEVIDSTTSRIEPFHSRFLAEALDTSFNGDRSLFDTFWSIATGSDPGWSVPSNVEITAEYVLDTGRVDIVIVDPESSRCLGIEIKTSEASTTEGQLDKYLASLIDLRKFSEIKMVYLTPFSVSNSDGHITSSISEFDSFVTEHPGSVHLSWLDVAGIDWSGGGELWQQHCEYVRNAICVQRSSSQRGLDEFFSPLELTRFWNTLSRAGGPDGAGEFSLDSIVDDQEFISAIRVLVDSPRNNKSIDHSNRINDETSTRLLNSNHSDLHRAFMELGDQYPWVWVEGKKNYGLRVARSGISGGLSVCTFEENKARVGQRR